MPHCTRTSVVESHRIRPDTIAMSQIILTEAERRDITQIPHYISDDDLLSFCAFDEEDMHNIVDRHKDLYNRLG